MSSAADRAAVAAMVLDAAPLLASALADCARPYGIRVQYTSHGVRVTSTSTALLAEMFEPLNNAFAAAGWGMHSSFSEGFETRTAVSFQPPHLLTQTGAPVADFPPR